MSFSGVVSFQLKNLTTQPLGDGGEGMWGGEDLRKVCDMADLLLYCRLEAMRALGLFCLLEGIPRPEGQMAALRAGLVWHEPRTEVADAAEEASEEAATRVVAAKALCDWAFVR